MRNWKLAVGGACAACCLLIEAVVASDKTPSRIREDSFVRSPLRLLEAAPANRDATPLDLDLGDYESLRPLSRVALQAFPVSEDAALDLELEQFDVLADDSEIVEGTPEGDVPIDRPDVLLFRGTVADRPDSSVFLSISPFGSHGWIRLSGQTYIVATAGSQSGESGTVAYSAELMPRDAIAVHDWVCGADALKTDRGLLEIAEAEVAEVMTDPEAAMALPAIAYVAIETDWEFTHSLFGGNLAASSAYATTLIAAVSEIYRREMQVSLKVPYLRLWSRSDDPWTARNARPQLYQFQEYWQKYMSRICRNTVHMLSGRRFTDAGGIAFPSGLCSGGFGYGLSGHLNGFFPYPLQNNDSQNWDVVVVAHEIGHNFSAPHSHDMQPPIDECGLGDCEDAASGTLMSYCHACDGGVSNIALTFHDRIVNERMRPYFASAPCHTCVMCGDGIVGGVEQCDDGNRIAGDGCYGCIIEQCADELSVADIEMPSNLVGGVGPRTYYVTIRNDGCDAAENVWLKTCLGVDCPVLGPFEVAVGSERRVAVRLLTPASLGSGGQVNYFPVTACLYIWFDGRPSDNCRTEQAGVAVPFWDLRFEIIDAPSSTTRCGRIGWGVRVTNVGNVQSPRVCAKTGINCASGAGNWGCNLGLNYYTTPSIGPGQRWTHRVNGYNVWCNAFYGTQYVKTEINYPAGCYDNYTTGNYHQRSIRIN